MPLSSIPATGNLITQYNVYPVLKKSLLAGANVTLTFSDATKTVTVDSASSSGGTTAVWGGITGTLASQADLQAALNAKADATSSVSSSRLPDFALGGLDYHLNISGLYIDTATLNGPGTLAGVANRLQLYPWTPSRDTTISQIGAEVTTGVASATFKALAYGADATSGGPGALLKETAALDGSTTGFKGEAWSYTFLKGTRYWLGTRHSSTATLRSYASTSMPVIGRSGAAAQASNLIQSTLTFATAASNPYGTVTTGQLVGPANAYGVVLLLA